MFRNRNGQGIAYSVIGGGFQIGTTTYAIHTIFFHALPRNFQYIEHHKQVEQVFQTIDDAELVVGLVFEHPDMAKKSTARHMMIRFCIHLCNVQCAIIRRCRVAHSAAL